MIAWAHDWLVYGLHLAARRVATALPLSVGYGLAASGGSLVYLLWPAKRRHAITNMARVVGPRAAAGLARASFRNYGKYMVDMLRLSGRQTQAVERRLVVRGAEHIEEALGRGKGLIFVGGHLGNSDLGAAVLAGRGYPVHAITETLHPPRWNKLVQEIRQLTGVQVIDVNANVREILRVLRRNEVLMILVDRPTHREGGGVPVRFFDAWTSVPAGAATLALRTGASVLAACMVRVGQGYVVHVSPLAPIERTSDLQADIQQMTQQIMTALEGFIRQYPEQWSMFRPMWPSAAEQGLTPLPAMPLAASATSSKIPTAS